MNQIVHPLPGTTIEPRYPESFRGSTRQERADQESLRADQEAQRAAELLAEVERLRAQLAASTLTVTSTK